MMETKTHSHTHTPGPWFTGDDHPSVCCWESENNSRQLAAMDPGSFVGESAANARLIAAAPELLEALESADLSTTQMRIAAGIGRKSAKNKVAWYESQLEQLSREIRQAIAKANGECE